MSLTFAGIAYTALLAVAGVTIATIPAHGLSKLAVVFVYVLLALALFWWGVTKGRDQVIAWLRKVLQLPSNRG